jgi:hypothetical protein
MFIRTDGSWKTKGMITGFTLSDNGNVLSFAIHITHLLLIFRLPYFVQMINFYRKQIMPKQTGQALLPYIDRSAFH